MNTSETLVKSIQAEISREGYLSFDRFMELALYTPGLGYYSKNSEKFGRAGDFVTAPEISPLFAKCIARQCQQALSPGSSLLEIGAGTGKLAAELLLELERLQCLPVNYFILEASESLQTRQQTFIKAQCPHLFNRVQWLNKLPVTFKGIILANEVMDAFPVKCFSIQKNEIKERCVGWENEEFVWIDKPAGKYLETQILSLQEDYGLSFPYISELNLRIKPWIEELCRVLQEGLILLFDYGYGRKEYYHPERTRGTLKCFYRHQQHENPLVNVGDQDITAHVDFTSVAEAAMNAGASSIAFTTQAAFLMASGLMDIAQEENLSTLDQYAQSQAIKTLILPVEMGEVIKVLGIDKNLDTTLLGFSLLDRRQDL